MADNRERDLVLAPNEFAFISDQTKGNIITYVGPYKTSMANTDKPVFFNKKIKRFDLCPLEDSIQTFTTAPESWYVVLKNPSKDGVQPQVGTSNTLIPLEIGRKVNLPGPRFFALWPGQMAEVIEGHHLRSNEYLIVRVYEEEQARKNWNKAVITPQQTTPEGLSEEAKPIDEDKIDVERLTMGQLLIIKGTDVSFYIPPTGVEVLRSEERTYVRKAVTLERLEYCILLDEDGNKRYITGPAVVFPHSTEKFIEQDGTRKFRAIELNEISGIYLKVIAPYEENGKAYKVGDELFITGKEQMIYFPRPEHALIKYGEQEIYHSVAIPPGEGRYYLNRNTGKVALQRGPCMFLPDPREAVIVRRILSDKQVALWFPGNQEALEYNIQLAKLQEEEEARSMRTKEEQRLEQQVLKKRAASQQVQDLNLEQAKEGLVGPSFSRRERFSKPRTITLSSKFDGAVTIDVWTGYAVLITSKSGSRKVIVGPQTYLLEYDEVIQGMELSTNTPKTDERLLRTAYLRVLNNKVSDMVRVETGDFCELDIKLSYRVNFTGEAEKWFDVENYVKFLTDNLRSVLRNAVKQYGVTEFYANGMQLVRDIILGKRDEVEQKRAGWLFPENGMHIYEVEVLSISLQDGNIQDLLFKAKHEEIRQKLMLDNREKELHFTKASELISREISETKTETKRQQVELEKQEAEKQLELDLTRAKAQFDLQIKKLESQIEEQTKELKVNELRLSREREVQELQLYVAERLLAQRLKEVEAEVAAVRSKAEAVSPDLIAALQAFGDKALAEKMAQSMAPLSIIGGKSLVEVFGKLLEGSPIAKVLQRGLAEDKQAD